MLFIFGALSLPAKTRASGLSCEGLFISTRSEKLTVQEAIQRRDLARILEAKELIVRSGEMPREFMAPLREFFVSLQASQADQYAAQRREDFQKWLEQYDSLDQSGFKYAEALMLMAQAVVITDLNISPETYKNIYGALPFAHRFFVAAEALLRDQHVVVLPVLNISTDPNVLLFSEKDFAFFNNIGILPLEFIMTVKNADGRPMTPAEFLNHDMGHYTVYDDILGKANYLNSAAGVQNYLLALQKIRDQKVKEMIFEILFQSQHESRVSFTYMADNQFPIEKLNYAVQLTNQTLTKTQFSQLRGFLLRFYTQTH